MSNLNDLINLAKADGGKFFVIDEAGDAKLVIMGLDDYERLLLGKLKRQIEDVEKINREILNAQLAEDKPVIPSVPKPPIKGPTLTDRQNTGTSYQHVDLRAEVIDPSFNFEGPKAEIDDL